MKYLAASLLLACCETAWAAAPIVPSGIEGYWFYREPPAPATVAIPAPVQPKPVEQQAEVAKKKQDCHDEKQWTVACGFVTPTTFSMQEKQRDALLREMVMDPGNPDAVRAVQEYTRWVLHQSTYAARVWQYNKLQDPKRLDPSAVSPISTLGLRLAMDVQNHGEQAVWSAIKDAKGTIIWFTKASCDYCHGQLGPIQALGRDTGIEVWDASLEGPCLEGYAKRCVPPEQATQPAQILHVDLVPTAFLYLPDNTWIRIGAGLTDTDTLKSRVYNLFISWKAAATGAAKATGDTGLALDPDVLPKDSSQLRELLMTPAANQAARENPAPPL